MLKDDIDELAVGDWCFMNQQTYIAVRLAEGDRGLAILPIAPALGRSHWEWNGSTEKPTLSPSIMHWTNGMGQPGAWHGYLRDGVLQNV